MKQRNKKLTLYLRVLLETLLHLVLAVHAILAHNQLVLLRAPQLLGHGTLGRRLALQHVEETLLLALLLGLDGGRLLVDQHLAPTTLALDARQLRRKDE